MAGGLHCRIALADCAATAAVAPDDRPPLPMTPLQIPGLNRPEGAAPASMPVGPDPQVFVTFWSGTGPRKGDEGASLLEKTLHAANRVEVPIDSEIPDGSVCITYLNSERLF
jgi:hypothetical protein